MVEEEKGHDNEDRRRKGNSNYKSVNFAGPRIVSRSASLIFP